MKEEKLRVILFKSRNKDNKEIEGFSERSASFLSRRAVTELYEKFDNFTREGLPGELSRFYISVNSRDNNKIRKGMIHYLVDNEEFDMAKIDSKLASIASLKENASSKSWMFDFDEEKHLINDFVQDIRNEVPSDVTVRPFQTPNGHAVVVGRGFDTRALLEKWKNVELKRDDMLCVDWMYSPKNKEEKK